MIQLIADSGSTNTDWAVVNGSTITHIKTSGINPVHQDDTAITSTLTQELLPHLQGVKPTHIHFYGAGCVGGTTNERLLSLLQQQFNKAQISINSDLLAAARSLCGNDKGIVGILGTGANSCLYDGCNIVANIPPLGYILGDEGSGASLGKAFLRALLRNELGCDMKEEFFKAYDTDYSKLIARIYREPAANRFLASLSPFIATHLHNETLQNIVTDTIAAYIDNHILRYNSTDTPLHLTGSVAFYYKEIITQVAQSRGITLGKVTRTPIEGLITYHSKQS